MIIPLLIWIIVFCVIAYVANWICVQFSAPRPVFWLVLLVLLLVLLVKITEITGVRLP